MSAKIGNIDVLLKPFNDIELLEKILKYRLAPLIENIKVPIKTVSNFRFKWNDGYKIGVEIIDDEHKQIVDHFEELYFNMSNGRGLKYYEQLLSFLQMYVNDHFEHEEKLQREISYDFADNHKILHENFKSQINQIIEEHKIKEVTNQELIRLTLFIKEWLIHHILVEDKKIAFFLASQSH
jgi:hemerythrin